MEVGRECESPDGGGTLPPISRWRGIIMCQQTITRPIRIIVKIHMPSCDTWEGFDVRPDARHHQPVEEDRGMYPRHVSLPPIATVWKRFPQVGHFAERRPRGLLHGTLKVLSILRGPKVINLQYGVIMK